MNLIFYQRLVVNNWLDGSIIDGGIYSYKSNLINKGIGLVDSVLLSSTLKLELKFWTLDKKILKFIASCSKFNLNIHICYSTLFIIITFKL
jgi:hypothetical protein